MIDTSNRLIHSERITTILGKCVAAWLVKNDPPLSTSRGMSLLVDVLAYQQEAELISSLQHLNALPTLRAFMRKRAEFYRQAKQTQSIVTELEAEVPITVRSGVVLWKDTPLGMLELFYQRSLPQEAQVQLAYETFRSRFLLWLEQHCCVLTIENGAVAMIFVPTGATSLDLTTEWKHFLSHALSATQLQQTFVLLLNSIVLSDRGFSVPDIPLVTQDQVDILIAFFYATLHAIEVRLKRLEQERQPLIALSNGVTQRKLTAKEETALKNLNERLEKQHAMYDQALLRMNGICAELKQRDAVHMQRIVTLAKAHTVLATRQLKVTQAIMEKAVARIEELLSITPEMFFQPPPLLTRELPLESMRYAGDFVKDMCYACGSVLPPSPKRSKKVVYTANKLILQSPSQTLQGHLQQVQPEICSLCALLSITCPIKMIDTGLVVSLGEPDRERHIHYLYEQQLRMFTMGELNITAGRYLMIPCTEQVSNNKLLIDQLGRKEYALLKIASMFPSDVLARFEVEVLFGAKSVSLQQRHLMALHFLIEVFQIRLDAFRQETNNQRYAAVADAIRYMAKDNLIFAIYRLMTGFYQQKEYSASQQTQIEDGLARYKERLTMDGEVVLAKRFRHIAGLTGVLYAFVSRAKSHPQQGTSSGEGGGHQVDTKQHDREIKKLLEYTDNHNHFTYEAAGLLSKRQDNTAQLWRSQRNYFIYDEAKSLLRDIADVKVEERETTSEEGQSALKFYYDDICKIYTVLYERYYPTEKAQRDFTYELKLSLYSRFPDLRPGNQSTNS